MNATTPRTLRIEGELSIFRAAELRQELLAALDGAAALDIDLSAVTELDSAGVQLLLAAGKSAHAGRKALRLLAPSAAVREVFALIDLAGAAGDSLTIA